MKISPRLKHQTRDSCLTSGRGLPQARPRLSPLCPTRMRERMTRQHPNPLATPSMVCGPSQHRGILTCPASRQHVDKLNGFNADAHDQPTPVTRQELPVFLLLDTPGGHQHCPVGVCGVRGKEPRGSGGATATFMSQSFALVAPGDRYEPKNARGPAPHPSEQPTWSIGVQRHQDLNLTATMLR